jgi:putative acetyltransferase
MAPTGPPAGGRDTERMEIAVEDPAQADIRQLLEAHLADMRAVSPPGSVHALEIEELRRPDITFWAARLDQELLGCGALLELSPAEGVETIVAEARRRGYEWLNLETGSQGFFAPAHRLYARHGFAVCGPFGSYGDDPNSTFMSRHLQQTKESARLPGMADATTTPGLAEGMRAMLALRARQLERGATALGWKVGFNAPAVQAIFGLDGPVIGYLTSRTLVPDGATVDLANWVNPALEVEVAARMGPDGRLDVIAPALELVDLDLPFDDLEPILAQGLFHRGVVLGPEAPPALCAGLEVVVSDLDLGTELATAALDEDPAHALEVTGQFLTQHGAALEPGQWVITGAIGSVVPLRPGLRLRVDFGRLGTLSMSCQSAP